VKHGMVLGGVSPDDRLVEMVELPNHPHFVGCQFHPEFKSRPHAPHPLFTSFVEASRARRDARASRESKVEVKDAGEPHRAVH
ncbi:MAG TPA: CTP synthetase, partial [Sandaracinaceae bacterium]